jgi:hypothetical protein
MERAALAAPLGFGPVLVTFVVTRNLGLMVFCSFHEVKGRFASALDLMKRAVGCYEVGDSSGITPNLSPPYKPWPMLAP